METSEEIKSLAVDLAAIVSELDYWRHRYDEAVGELHRHGYWQFGRLEEIGVQLYTARGGMTWLGPPEEVFELLAEGPTPHYSEVLPHCRASDRPAFKDSHRERRLKLLQDIGAAGSWVCVYCLRSGDEEHGPDGRRWHIDHLFPRAEGGDSKKDNLVLSCASCNLQKNRSLLQDFLTKRLAASSA